MYRKSDVKLAGRENVFEGTEVDEKTVEGPIIKRTLIEGSANEKQ